MRRPRLVPQDGVRGRACAPHQWTWMSDRPLGETPPSQVQVARRSTSERGQTPPIDPLGPCLVNLDARVRHCLCWELYRRPVSLPVQDSQWFQRTAALACRQYAWLSPDPALVHRTKPSGTRWTRTASSTVGWVTTCGCPSTELTPISGASPTDCATCAIREARAASPWSVFTTAGADSPSGGVAEELVTGRPAVAT